MKRTRTKWTTDDDNTLIAMRKEGKTYKQIARKLKRSKNSIATRITTLRNRHGDDVIYRGGAKQARENFKTEKKANAKTLKSMEMDNFVTPLGRSVGQLTAELKGLRNLFRRTSAEKKRLKDIIVALVDKDVLGE